MAVSPRTLTLAAAVWLAACGGGAGGDAGPPATVGFESASTLVDELSADVMLPVVLSAPVNDTVSVDYTISGGTATQGEDYTATNGTVTFAAGQTESFVPLNITFDELEEVNETIVFALENAQNAELGTSVHSVTINADILPRLNLTLDRSDGPENQGTQIEVTINTAPSVDVTVNYTVGGSASNPADHDLASGVITFPAGSAMSQVITLNVTDDPLDEDDETVVFDLNNAINALLEGTVQRTHTIVDNDATPTVGFTAGSTTGPENVAPEWPRVRLSAISGRVVTVNYAPSNGSAGGSDYSAGTGQLVFQPGEQEHAVPMNFTNDNIDEDTQSFTINLSNLVNADAGTLTHTANINDDDPTPTVSITTGGINQGEANTTLQVNVSISNPSERNPSVQFGASGATTAGGGDYSYGIGPNLNFSGTTSINIPVNISEDSLDEDDELIRTVLSNPNNLSIGTSTQDIVIGDNDAPPSVGWLSSESDGDGAEGDPASGSSDTRAVNYTIRLSAASGKNISVVVTLSGSGSGASDSNFGTGSPVVITAGNQSRTVTLNIVRDNDNEPQGGGDETVTMTLSAPVNASLGTPTARSYVIHDDD